MGSTNRKAQCTETWLMVDCHMRTVGRLVSWAVHVRYRNCVLIKQQHWIRDVIWYGYLQPFSPYLWVLLILTNLVMILCVNTFNRVKHWYFGGLSSGSRDTQGSVDMLGVFCMQGQRREIEIETSIVITQLINSLNKQVAARQIKKWI